MGKIVAKWLYKRLERMRGVSSGILYNDAVHDNLKTLEPAGDISKIQKEYVIKKLSICIMIVVTGTILSIALWIKEEMEIKIVDNRLERNVYGEGEKNVVLSADDGENIYDIPINIGEKEYSRKELEELSAEMLPLLENSILGENKNFDKVEHDIRLVRNIEGYPFNVTWSVDERYIDCDGHLVNDVLEIPKPVELTAQIKCDTFELEHTMYVMVHTKAVQPGDALLIAKNVNEEESESRNAKYMTLPSEFNNKNIKWSYKKTYNGLLFLAATPVLTILIYYSSDRDLYKKVIDRNEQMRIDYPDIVSSFALLIGAGMAVPNAWKKIATDYKRRKEETGKKRYAYEEILLTVYEMESGVVQTKAYENFGRRCRIPDYNKLSTLLSQNIRKGASNLPLILKEEAQNAFEERKHMARQLGEKAGTKLLVPMMMLLGMIMVIILIPAFSNVFN